MTAASPEAIPPSVDLTSVDLTKPSVARVYDWYLGGGHHWEIDRQFGVTALSILPSIKQAALLNRAFLTRALDYAVANGVRQFLDLGSGMCSVGAVHELTQTADPAARVVYVDNDPVAVSHGRLILADNRRATAITGDVRDPATILAHPETDRLLDFSQPILVIMASVLHFVAPEHRPAELVAQFREVLAPGSHLAISHLTAEGATASTAAAAERLRTAYTETSHPLFFRDSAEIASWFDGLTLIDPGVVHPPQWRPDHVTAHWPEAAQRLGLCGMGRK